ncbi:hypothetical protein BHE74_00041578 [Ensete ventricosum]|nr:hypothetical protein BHE74_00041578 [Ensete ventricosum]
MCRRRGVGGRGRGAAAVSSGGAASDEGLVIRGPLERPAPPTVEWRRQVRPNPHETPFFFLYSVHGKAITTMCKFTFQHPFIRCPLLVLPSRAAGTHVVPAVPSITRPVVWAGA